jgi:hypothetical protein
MMAVIPIHTTEVTRPAPWLEGELYLLPSSAAKGKQRAQIVLMPSIKRDATCGASRFFDPFEREGEVILDFTQIDYLDLVRNIELHISRTGNTISKPWIEEIGRVERSLRHQRQYMASVFPVSEWTKQFARVWDFEVPDYDPTAGTRWDSSAGTWEDVILR